jgi:hypothetical protein
MGQSQLDSVVSITFLETPEFLEDRSANAYVQELKTDQNGRVIDTLYIPKTEKIKQQRNEQYRQLRTRLDSIKNTPQQ